LLVDPPTAESPDGERVVARQPLGNDLVPRQEREPAVRAHLGREQEQQSAREGRDDRSERLRGSEPATRPADLGLTTGCLFGNGNLHTPQENIGKRTAARYERPRLTVSTVGPALEK
jgi:hypothetical protein